MCALAPAAPVAELPADGFNADDSGARPHIVEPVLCDAYEAFLDSLARWVLGMSVPLPGCVR